MIAEGSARVRVLSLRARVRASIIVVAALSVLLFAVPLAVVIQRMNHTEAVTELQRDAVGVAAMMPDTESPDASPLQLPIDLPDDRSVGVYSTNGRLSAHSGPAVSSLAASAIDGRTHIGSENAELAVSAPVVVGGAVVAVVRVSTPAALVAQRTRKAWIAMAVLGALALTTAALLARSEGQRIAKPLERLTISARALGDGDFTIHSCRSRIAEVDTLGDALEATAKRLGALIERERAFTTQVSHQLRTPLTALLLGLESALARRGADLRKAAVTALRRGEQLGSTIEDLLRLARDTETRDRPPLAVPQLFDAVRNHWHAAFTERDRPFQVQCAPDLPEVDASTTAIRHVIEVLVDNALVHGAGRTLVEAQAVAEGLLIQVSDQGPGLSDPDRAFAPRDSHTDGTHRIGLALARTLAEAEGGRLVVRHAAPHPTFGLLLPSAPRSYTADGTMASVRVWK
ncbi:histidine kinase dimerization/phospho-acceptor domain-containing protein [Nocardia sp. NPDC020380]|uniref:sensor histidine kinase n=1 Tax=Nocardia sp. NPDC020380 TaxID=3364309 RepID=UPI0037895E59